jgi:hypothetical protein
MASPTQAVGVGVGVGVGFGVGAPVGGGVGVPDGLGVAVAEGVAVGSVRGSPLPLPPQAVSKTTEAMTERGEFVCFMLLLNVLMN